MLTIHSHRSLNLKCTVVRGRFVIGRIIRYVGDSLGDVGDVGDVGDCRHAWRRACYSGGGLPHGRSASCDMGIHMGWAIIHGMVCAEGSSSGNIIAQEVPRASLLCLRVAATWLGR